MSKKLLNAAIAVALAMLAFVAFVLPASAAQRTFRVRLATGAIVTVSVDAPCGTTPSLPGTPIEELTPPSACAPAVPQTPAPTSPTAPPSQPQQPPQQPGGTAGGRPNAG